MKTADEVFAEVLTPDQHRDLAVGRPVEVTLTREQLDAIEADPMRQIFNALDRALDAAIF